MQKLNKQIEENKSLRAENDALRTENNKVKQRISQIDEKGCGASDYPICLYICKG